LRAIFISYRRSDSEGEAGRLFDDLVAHFGEQMVFMDVAGIEAGRDFRKVIEESIAGCGVLLVMMGPSWATAKDENGRLRLEDPNDFVREEVASALRRDIPVIPVLVRGAKMPRPEQLPESVKDLVFRNAVELTHARWKSDVQLTIDSLRRLVGGSGEVRSAAQRPSGQTVPAVAASSLKEDIGSRFNAAMLQKVTRELALEIGPIADVMVKRAATACQSEDELYSKLADEIESPNQRAKFLSRLRSRPAAVSAPINAAASPGETAVRIPASQTVLEQPAAARPAASQSRSLKPYVIAVAAIVVIAFAVVIVRGMLSPSANTNSASDRQPPSTQSDPNESQRPSGPAPAVEPAGIPKPATEGGIGAAGEATRPQIVHLSPEAAHSLLAREIVPAYPQLARQARIQGEVILDAEISKTGSVENLKAASGHPMLIPAAIDAVKQWQYRPYVLNGEPVAVQTQITVHFSLKSG
jgi:TonB family protein